MHHSALVFVGLLLAVCADAALAAPPEGAAATTLLATPGAADACFPPLLSGKVVYRGSRTCQAAACHGSITPRSAKPGVPRRDEFTVWREKDPHATKAYASINPENKTARAILENLGIAKGTTIVDKAGYDNCKKCHDLDLGAAATATSHEGVSCEACHGPSDKWYAEHYKVGWVREKAEGLIDTKKAFTRARLCTQCHVGAADREVNHDLLAAGHPQMRFELAGYLQLMPKHWNEEVQAQLELRLWTAGQIASADAALEVLEARAQRAVEKKPRAIWPEFSESDCFACHHDLNYPSWRQKRGFGQRHPGNLPWGNWHFGVFQQWASKNGDADGQAFQAQVVQLQNIMEGRIAPDPESVLKQVRAARQALCRLAQPNGSVVDKKSKPGQMRSLFGAYSGGNDEGKAAVENWEVAVQVYLAIAAMDKSYRDENKSAPQDKPLADLIKGLRTELAFTAGYDSPREFVGEATGTNLSQRDKVRTNMLKVFQRFEQRGEK